MSDPNPGDDQQTLKRHRWEDPTEVGTGTTATATALVPASTRWSTATPRQYAGGETPRMAGAEQSTWRGMATPTATQYNDDLLTAVQTPQFGTGSGPQSPSNGFGSSSGGGATPSFFSGGGGVGGATPMFGGAGGATPAAGSSSIFAPTPNYQFEGSTPVQSHFAGGGGAAVAGSTSAMTAAIEAKAKQLEREWRAKNKRLTAEFLDSVVPSEYFSVVSVPADYNPPMPEEPNFYEAAVRLVGDSAFFTGGQGEAAAAADGDPQQQQQQPVMYDIPDNLGDGMPAMRPEDAPVFVELLRFHGVDPIPDESLPSYLLMRSLFRIKNGDTGQRRAGTRYLLGKCHAFGSTLILQRIFTIWTANIMDLEEQHRFIDLIKALIAQLGKEVRGSTREVVHLLEPLLSSPQPVLREDGKQALILLTRVVGFPSVFDAIKVDFAHQEGVVRRHTAKVAAIVGYATSPEELLAALVDMSYSPLPFARQTSARVLTDLATLAGHGVMAVLPDMVAILERLIRDEKRVRRDAAGAVAAIAEAVAPYGIEELEPLVDVVTDVCRKGLGSSAAPFLHAFGALVPLMSPYDAQQRTAAMMPTLVGQFNTPEDEYRRVLLRVVERCVAADGVTPPFIRDVVLDPFFEGFWRVRRVAGDRRTAHLLVETTFELARKLGSVDVLLRLVPEMKDENDKFQGMVINAVRSVVEVAGTAACGEALVVALLDGAIAAVRQDELGMRKNVMLCLATVCNSLGARLKPYLKQIFDLVNRRRESREAPMRAHAAELVTHIAHTVVVADGTFFLQDLGRSLYERLEDDDAYALAANLRATRAILSELGAQKYKPSVRELLKKLTFAIKNRQSVVQANAIALVEDIAASHDEEVDAIHLYELATKGLFELLDSERRETRRACARTFGIIARAIRPFAIILELVNNFSQDKRKIRICTAVALGAIAKECGPFTVLPYLLNEYKLSEGKQVAVIVQHSVLKAIRYVFEYIGGAAGREFVLPVVPLLERALTETGLQMRRMAVEACTAIVQAIAGEDGFEGVVTHLLNFVHPNIVELLSKNEVKVAEERLKMVTAVVSYYEAARLVLGSGKLLQYLAQGLFHPSRKVRDIYRRTYNMVYVGNPEGLVPYYPRVDDEEGRHAFVRHELEVII